jgi:hypothetical protein
MGTKIGDEDGWCDQEDTVPDGDRIYRCSKCRKRLHPRKIFGTEGEVTGFKLPPHKRKGHKIKALKARQRKIRTGRK